MICDKCGREIPADSKFCVFCGNKLAEVTTGVAAPITTEASTETVLDAGTQTPPAATPPAFTEIVLEKGAQSPVEAVTGETPIEVEPAFIETPVGDVKPEPAGAFSDVAPVAEGDTTAAPVDAAAPTDVVASADTAAPTTDITAAMDAAVAADPYAATSVVPTESVPTPDPSVASTPTDMPTDTATSAADPYATPVPAPVPTPLFDPTTPPSPYGAQPVQNPYGDQQPVAQQAPYDPAQPYPASAGVGAPDPYGAPPQSPYGAPQGAYYQPQPYPGAVQEPPKKKKTWIVLLVVGIVAICCILPCILGTIFYNDISRILFGYATTTVTTPGSNSSGNSGSSNDSGSSNNSGSTASSYTLVDNDGIKITVDPDSGYNNTALEWYEVAVTVENKTDKELDIYFSYDTSADGYRYLEVYMWPDTDDMVTTFSPNKTHSGEIVFFDTDGKGVKNIEGTLEIYDYATDKLIGKYEISIPEL